MQTVSINNVEISGELLKAINKVSFYSTEQFTKDVQAYLNAVVSGRMCCIIDSVSKSGMSRTLAFKSCEMAGDRAYYRQYIALFTVLGYKAKGDYFRISGCGMNMVFYTNYSIINALCLHGFISKEQAEQLNQLTPTVL